MVTTTEMDEFIKKYDLTRRPPINPKKLAERINKCFTMPIEPEEAETLNEVLRIHLDSATVSILMHLIQDDPQYISQFVNHLQIKPQSKEASERISTISFPYFSNWAGRISNLSQEDQKLIAKYSSDDPNPYLVLDTLAQLRDGGYSTPSELVQALRADGISTEEIDEAFVGRTLDELYHANLVQRILQPDKDWYLLNDEGRKFLDDIENSTV
jgi:hypothetical protein